MMANNLEQVDQYVMNLMKQKGFAQVVPEKPEGKRLPVVPIMGLSARLGTVAVEYQSQAPSFS